MDSLLLLPSHSSSFRNTNNNNNNPPSTIPLLRTIACSHHRYIASSQHANSTSLPRNHTTVVTSPVAVAAAAAALSTTASRLAAQNEEEVLPWRLDNTLLQLRQLRAALLAATSLAEKHELLDMIPRVRAVFGNIRMARLHANPIVALALESLGEYEIYLLKCLVASGQEHVLDITPVWLEQVGKIHCTTQQAGGDPLPSEFTHLSSIKNVFSMVIRLTESSKTGAVKHSDIPVPLYDPSKVSFKNPSSRVQERTITSAKSMNGRKQYNNDSLREGLMHMLRRFVKILHQMETFYDCIGGIIGYQMATLELIKAAEVSSLNAPQSINHWSQTGPVPSRYFVPIGPDLSQDDDYAVRAALWGLESMPAMGEIYPLGGAGDRLGLVDDVTGDSLPVAMLPYCGRTLLEGLIRDLQAREYLHFKVFGRQHITPVAIMTSAAKKNNEHVMNLCKNRGWFGRGRSNFLLFEQPLIPAIAAENGAWLISEPLMPVLKPGGHGVIWKLAHDNGVFEWFYKKGRKAAIVRQISNPVASTDVTLLALSGIGIRQKKKFGFASCKRNVGTAEGVNVLVERSTGDGWEYGVTCLEYTEFSKLGIVDVPASPGSMQAQYPANTNVLYVDLPSVEHIASCQCSTSLPGMILNLKKPIVFKDYLGVSHSVFAGRIECTMQNVVDSLLNKQSVRLSSIQYESLDTFVIYNQRRKVTSSAKRRRKPNDFSLHQTPDGSFLDVTRNAHDLLTSCMVDMPEMENIQHYLEFGPPFIVLLHPGLGPIWEIVRQKIHGGTIAKGSELQIEVAEFVWRDVKLNGSLLIHAENIMGSLRKDTSGETILHYGEGCGRCRLERVLIVNRGIDWSSKDNIYWQHKVNRLESLKIVLHGNAEFEAFDVILEGSHTFEVPEGHIMRVTWSKEGLSCILEPLPTKALSQGTWYWNYSLLGGGHVHLELTEL